MCKKKEIIPGVAIEPRMAKTSMGPVEYDITDGDGPVVMSIHAGLGGVDMARLTVAWLDPVKYRLLSLSRPGYLGTPLSSGRSLEAQADLFAALLNYLGIAQVAVVTLSAGGASGYFFAARHPDRVRALVAISSVSGRYYPPESTPEIMQSLMLSQFGMRMFNLIARKKPKWVLREMLEGTGYLSKDLVRRGVEEAMRTPESVEFARGLMSCMNPYSERKLGNENDMRLFRELDHAPVEEIQCPTLVIHGTHDSDVKFWDGVYAHEHIPGAERLWLEEGCHLSFWLRPHAEHAQEVARGFLRRHHT